MDLMSFALVTRYNVKTGFTAGTDVNDPEWLAGRRELFARYCAPSVRAQTDKRFTWFVFVDRKIPDDESAWIESLGECTIVRCGSQSEGMNIIRPLISEGHSLTLSARLDSDDSVAPTYVEQMRLHAERGSGYALSGNRGLVVCFGNGVMHHTEDDMWFDRYYPNNAFIGLLEPVSSTRPPGLVFQRTHYYMCLHYDTMTVRTDEPMWCIRVHGRNVANDIQGNQRAAAPAVFEARAMVADSA